jgi:hypothetical protein
MTDSIKISTQLYEQLNYDPYYFRTRNLLQLLGKYVYEDQFGEYGKIGIFNSLGGEYHSFEWHLQRISLSSS